MRSRPRAWLVLWRTSLPLMAAGLAAVSIDFHSAIAQQIPALLDVPPAVAAHDSSLAPLHDRLVHERETLRARFESHNAQCSNVERGSSSDAACLSERGQLVTDRDHHVSQTNQFNARIRCATAQLQAKRLRDTVEQTRQTAEQNQEDLADWAKMNEQAQKAALWSGLEFAMAYYAADAQGAQQAADKAERRAAKLADNYAKSGKRATRLRYLAKLRSAVTELTPLRATATTKQAVYYAADADQAWNAARNTMKDEFAVAAKHDDNLKELMRDPGFRDAFTGDPDEEPGMEVLQGLWDQAIAEATQATLTATRYEALAAPAVAAGIFLREEAYDALESLLSTERVAQLSQTAGQLAKATGVWQQQYEKAVKDLRSCGSK